MSIAPDQLRDPWWKSLPTREEHGIANTKNIHPDTDLCGVCGVCRWRHDFSTATLRCGPVGSDWRIAYFVGDYDQPVEFFEQAWDTGVGVDTDVPLKPIQVIPPRPADTTP